MYKIILLMVLPILLYANIGKITASRGDVKVIRDSKEISAKSGTILEENDHVKTSKNGKLQIVFVDKTVFTLGKNSTLDISEYLYDESRPKRNKVKFAVLKGAFSTITGRIGKLNKSKFKLRTKSASIGIRGTIVKANQTMVMCTQGAITVTSIVSGDSVRVEAGYKTETKGDTVTAPSEIKSGDVESLGVDKMKVSKVITPVETIKPKVILPTVVSPQAKKFIMTGRTIESDGSQQLVTIDGETFDDAIADSGLQAVDDSWLETEFNAGENISWGHWEDDPSKKWVAGYETPISYLDQISNDSKTVNASYNGKVMGNVNGDDDIKMDSTNQVQMNFELGGGKNTMNGSINFQTESGQNWNSEFGGSTSGNSFSTTSISGDGNGKAVTSGGVDGNFYGDEAQSIGGTFQMNTETDKATGVFKANK